MAIVAACRLSFIGTLIYASVIYHRHRRHTPYHRSDREADSDSHNARYNGPFADPKIDAINRTDRTFGPSNRDSTTAPEIDIDASTRPAKQFRELDYGTEIREMHSPEETGDEKKRLRGDGPKELQGDDRIYELSAEKSVRGSKKAMTVVIDEEKKDSK
ncbi:MAG: hypothetical protein Q9186_002942 [Xanthomendoza sp. 1 TL-2023]